MIIPHCKKLTIKTMFESGRPMQRLGEDGRIEPCLYVKFTFGKEFDTRPLFAHIANVRHTLYKERSNDDSYRIDLIMALYIILGPSLLIVDGVKYRLESVSEKTC